jgi:site-specific recombinase XerC
MFFDHLVLRGTLRHSPARLLKNGRTDRPIPKALTDDEVKRFERALAAAAKESAIGRRDQVLLTLLLKSGMRLTAALAIDVEDLNLDDCSLVSRGKHGRIQGVYLPRRVARMLRRHIREQGGDTGGAVFRSSQGRRLSARQAQYRFRLVLALAGIDRPVTVHSLRHRFAVELHKRTGDLQVVQTALGHRQLGTTQVYSCMAEPDASVLRAVLG